MIIIAHRINTRQQLASLSPEYGVELDLRSFGNELIIHHEPFEKGESFSDWLSFYSHKTLILNVKEEGLEARSLELMKQNDITDFFFLDQSFPFLIKTSNLGESRCAVRVSEFESIDTALSLAGKVNWVWVDCFTKLPLSENEAEKLHKAGFRLCFVSPELQGRKDRDEVKKYRQSIDQISNNGDAVCTKYPDLWE